MQAAQAYAPLARGAHAHDPVVQSLARARRCSTAQLLLAWSLHKACTTPPPPPPCTNWTRLVLLPVLTGHVAAQGVYYPPARPHAHRRASSRRAGPRARHRAAASLPPPSPPQGFVCLPRSTRQERLLENLRTNRTLSASTPHLVSLSRPICTLAPTVRTGALEVRLSADDMAALDSLGTGT